MNQLGNPDNVVRSLDPGIGASLGNLNSKNRGGFEKTSSRTPFGWRNFFLAY